MIDKKIDYPRICPKCGCQCYDPFWGKTVIHNIETCKGQKKIQQANRPDASPIKPAQRRL